ncbi:MAG: low-complexity protein, partial [Thermosynechococcaceae cyanobacterium]
MTAPVPPVSPDPDPSPKSDLLEDLSQRMVLSPRTKPSAALTRINAEAESFLGIAAIAATLLGIALILRLPWLGIPAAITAIALAGRILWPTLKVAIDEWVPRSVQLLIGAGIIGLFSLVGLLQLSGVTDHLTPGDRGVNWEAISALGETFGAIGQILVAFLALYVAWRQYVISKDLTSQQNRITQQQTIDAYFQGISDLV